MVLAMIKEPTATITCLEEFHLTITCHCFDSGRGGGEEEVQQKAARARDSAVETLRRDLRGEHHGAKPDVFQDDCRFVAGEALLDEAGFSDPSCDPRKHGSPSPKNMPLLDAVQQCGERG